MVKWIYDDNCVGLPLHVVLEDWGLDDETLERNLDRPRNPEEISRFEFEHRTPGLLQMGIDCATTLLTMTAEERASAMALSEGLLLEDGSISAEATEYLVNPPRMLGQYIKAKRTPDGPLRT